MANWPALVNAKYVLPITETPDFDPTIRSSKEDGSVTTRLRFPAVPKRFTFTIRAIDDTDLATLKTFQHTTVGYGSGTFNWTHPRQATVFVVRLGAPFVFTNDIVPDLQTTPVTLVEAVATE